MRLPQAELAGHDPLTESVTFSYPAAFTWASIAILLVLAVVVWTISLKRGRYVLLLLVVILAALGILVPSYAMHRIELDDVRIEERAGRWYRPTVQTYPLADLSMVEIRTDLKTRRDAPTRWFFHYTGGRTETLDPSELWQKNSDEIILRLRARGIPVELTTWPAGG